MCLRATFVEPPRKAAAIRMGKRLRTMFSGAELIPYVWHLVTHLEVDGMRQLGTRSLHGPAHAFGGLQETPEVEQAWDAVAATARGFGANRVLLHTAPSLGPGALGQARLAHFVERATHDGFGCVWQPSGLWTADQADTTARTLGIPVVWPAADASRCAESPPAQAWRQIERRGRGGSLSPDLLEHLAEDARAGHTLLFRGTRALANLKDVRDALS